ncbi:alkaline phosphatase family protein [Chloroflexus sp.]|uniref:alkaline phosphatase family protein n=1 Tax=Chloroflexus sp. TaxID=1904827 RepID=UPI002ACEE8A5|nr:alkaline phosphatase family protein [Chloroflexus sp.]
MNTPKLLVIGLDCAAPELIFSRWFDQLPVMRSLIEKGTYGRMESCIPAITVPAWACMMSSQDPGQLGIYGFRNRADYSYDAMVTANARSINVPRLWDLLGAVGKRVGVIGVPLTYPVAPINGELVSCFLTPNAQSQFTYPPELRNDIISWIGGDFLVDVPNFRTTDKERVLRDIYRMAEQRFVICRNLLQRQSYDFLMMVDMGVDRIHHGFWKDMDPAHPKYIPNSPFAHAIFDYYAFIDRQIGELLSFIDEDTAVLIISDHGGKPIQGGLCLNEWLIREGYLVLEEMPRQPAPLERCRINWQRTRAWGSGGYYGRIFVNVAGREPYGIVTRHGYESLRDEISAKLIAMVDHTGQRMNNRVFKPEQIYRQVRGVAPDLLVYFGDLDWRSVGSVGYPDIYTFENDTGPDEANHAQFGMFIFYDPRHRQSARYRDISIYDVAPTILNYFNQPIPDYMIGRPFDFS